MTFLRDSIKTNNLTAGKVFISSDELELCFKEGSIGPKFSFRKKNYSNHIVYRDKIIPGVLEIARENNQGGIYNYALESNFNTSDSPLNTEWNTPFLNPEDINWGPLGNIQNRTYDTWYNAILLPDGENAAPNYVGIYSILHETTTDRYWLIKFTEWTPGGNGGGFAYDRWEIYPEIEFERPNYSENTIDVISDGVHLKRDNNQGGIYNSVVETEFIAKYSPEKTRWNSSYTDFRSGYSGFGDLSNLENRVYTDFANALDYSVGNNIIGEELIMHDLTTDLYHKFVFDIWQSNGNGGGFRYVRQVIPQSCVIRFGDGSVLSTASSVGGGGGNFPYVDAQGNTIIADSTNNTDNVAGGDSHLIADFSGMLLVNDHFSGRVELWIAGGGSTQLVSNTEGVSLSTLTQNGNGYEWTNVDNLNGPFTFTVIKTRDTA